MKRRKKTSSRRNPAHLDWLRTLSCCVGGCDTRTPVQAHHVRTAANSGVGMKPPDHAAVPLCLIHHAALHVKGRLTFEQTYGLDLMAIARELAALSGSAMP